MVLKRSGLLMATAMATAMVMDTVMAMDMDTAMVITKKIRNKESLDGYLGSLKENMIEYGNH